MWPRLSEDLSEFQFAMCDEQTREVIAEAHTVPCWWDGTTAGVSDGFDATIADAFDRLDTDQPVNTLCAIAAEVPRGARGGSLAYDILKAMGTIAARHGLTHMIAPVRPTWKDRYPITPIERYMTWRRDDGSLQDPWLRLHERMGARGATSAQVIPHRRDSRGMGIVARDGIPRVGRLRVPGRAFAAGNRP
jgi:hypothetical protein